MSKGKNANEGSWVVRDHGPLVQVDDGIFTVDGSVHVPIGEFPRRMSVVRLAGRRLIIYSAICLDEPRMRELEAVGHPAFLVVPNAMHRLDALAFKQRYPDIVVVAPAGAREKVQDEVPVDTTKPRFDDADVTMYTVLGTQEHELAIEVKRESGTTLIVNDVIANIRHADGVRGWLLKLMGFAGDEPHVPGPVSLLMVKEKAALRQQLLDWSDLPNLRRILMAHGEPIEGEAAAALRTLAKSLD